MSDQTETRDPVVHSSLSKPLFIWSALLVLSMVWGLYDEMYGIRPWKGYEARFEKLYAAVSDNASAGRAQARRAPDQGVARIQRSIADMQAAEKAAMPEASAIDQPKSTGSGSARSWRSTIPSRKSRSHIGSLTYQIEVTNSESRKNSLRKQIAELKAEVHKVELPGEPRQADEVRPDGPRCSRHEGQEGRACCSSAWR